MMNRKIRMLALALVCASWSAAGLAGQPTAQCETRAQAALQAFTHDGYDKTAAHFAPGLASKATADKLHAAWNQFEAKFGTFQTLGKPAPRKIKGYAVLVAPLTFDHGNLDALITCNDSAQITGFRFVPASMLPAASNAKQADAASALPPGMARFVSVTKAHSLAPHQAVKAHVEADGVRVIPLTVSSPLGPLPGVLTLPAGKGPFPAVVLVQGSGSSDMDETIGPNKPFRDMADGLARAGIASLRYNKRNYVYAKKTADNPTPTVDDEVTDDALTALHLLAKQEHVDPHRIFVLGHSLGAQMAPRIATRDPQVAGVVMLAAPARPLLAVMQQQVREDGPRQGMSQAQIDAAVKADAAEAALLDKADPAHPPKGTFFHAPQSYWLSLHDYHQVAVAKKLSRPLLILQGGSDFQVSPTQDFSVWKRALGDRSDVTFHLYPGLSHLFRPAGKTKTLADYLQPRATDPKVISDIARWIKAQPAR